MATLTTVPHVSLSPLDEARFGVRSARTPFVTRDSLPDVLTFCHDHEVEFLVARCPTTEISTAQALEHVGFLLMDTLVYYSRDLLGLPLPTDTGTVPIRPVRAGDELGVERVATSSFRLYGGHYHADSRLDRAQCDAAYVSWAVRSCTVPGVADAVLVAELAGEVVGFGTLQLNSADEGEGLLFGVSAAAQGHGIYRSIMIDSLAWFKEHGASRMIISTQITNMASQKVWSRLGFEPRFSYYTFHKWFERN